MTKRLILLGLETSCDETAAAVVCREADGKGRILANVVLCHVPVVAFDYQQKARSGDSGAVGPMSGVVSRIWGEAVLPACSCLQRTQFNPTAPLAHLCR